ncbi:MAG: hypothetical protein DRP09_10840 [Candidatus Thorarchaeota archaeon]|nr:MAG: hypothetical protein DRP09_10840 [Candidatus Thorarchaeota archaeon]
MNIPMLSDFVEGLKIFFASKRLRWLTLVFFIGAIVITIWERLLLSFPVLLPLGLLSSGIFPGFFLITAIASFLGLGRFVADEESYFRSFITTVIWMALAGILMLWLVLYATFIYQIIFIVFAFLGWIVFQSYFATRSSLKYAGSVQVESRSRLARVLFVIIYFFNYFIVLAALIGTLLFVNPSAFGSMAMVFALIGVLLTMGFNFINGLILAAERNRSTASNVAFLGFFISVYSAYFIYNVLKPFDPSLDVVSISISIFFILYTMSGVGRTLASRAEQDTRWKLSKELAATLTYFLASGFMFVDASISQMVSDPTLVGSIGDAVKLLIFPFVALVMEVIFLMRSRKPKKPEPAPEDVQPTPEEEPTTEGEDTVSVEEPVEEEITPEEPVDLVKEPLEEPTTEPESEDHEPDNDES